MFVVKIFLFILALMISIKVPAYSMWELDYQPRQRLVKTIADYKDTLFIGTGDGIFTSFDSGKTWNDFGSEMLHKDENGLCKINWIYIKDEKIYIATSYGAYVSNVHTPEWKEVFSSVKTESFNINSISVVKDDIYLSTNDGAWICNENKSCERFNSGIETDNSTGNYLVNFIGESFGDLYLTASNGVYKLDKKKKIWINVSSGIQKLYDGNINANYIFHNKNDLWLAAGTGIYCKNKKEKAWVKDSFGLDNSADGIINAFYITKISGMICAGLGSGVFCRGKNSWSEFDTGIRTANENKNVYYLIEYNNSVFAATDEGLFGLHERNSSTNALNTPLVLKGKIEKDFTMLEELEPSVLEVQEQALKFSALPSDKDFKKYRAQARIRNLLPAITLTAHSNRDRYDYFQGEKGIDVDPASSAFASDITSRYQNSMGGYGQIGILWNARELIYDDEISDLIGHARLTANIRENILDDVTRIYFVRRKLQLENILNPSLEVDQNLKKQIEISELTGQIDSRTGGWFSEDIKRRRKKYNL